MLFYNFLFNSNLTASGKIRFLLALIGVSLLLAAIAVQKAYTPVNNLVQTAQTLESNLHKKEAFIYDQLNNKQKFEKLKSLPDNDQDAINGITEFTTEKNTWFVTTFNNKLKFWSGIKVLPDDLSVIKEGSSFIEQPNGYYEAIKKTEGDFSIVFFIPVKNNYAFTNQYLQNNFAKDLVNNNDIEITYAVNKDVYQVHSSHNNYLFSVKQKPNGVNYAFIYYQLIFWVLTLLTLCVLIHNICNSLVVKQRGWVAVTILASFIIIFRAVSLYYHLPNFGGVLTLFDPKIYHSGILYPSFGDLCINILCVFWFVTFVYLHRRRLFTAVYGNTPAYLTITCCLLILIAVSTSLLRLFYDLVINSHINFDVNNVLRLSSFSVLGVLILCFSFLIFYLINEIVLFMCLKLDVPKVHQLALLIITIAITTAVFAIYYEFTLFYILWSLLVVIRGYGFLYQEGKLHAGTFLAVLLICALISAVKLNHFEDIKESANRKILIHKLEKPDDRTAEYLFKQLEAKIKTDTAIVSYFKGNVRNAEYLDTRFQKLYFDGYLSKYMLKIHEYNVKELPVVAEDNYSMSVFTDMVMLSAIKVSDYFYRENESFGFQNYFAIIPIVQNNKQLGSLVVELKSKQVQTGTAFPDLLIDGNIKSEDEFKNYSYAYYSDNKLLSQKGNYVYTLNNPDFNGVLKKYIIKTTRINNPEWYDTFTKYEHLIYKPSKRNLIVVSREINPLYYGVTSVTFFFMALLMFSAFIIVVRGAWIRTRVLTITDDKIRWKFRINYEKVLYKTRIQYTMIFTVVITLILVGFITFISIGNQYHNQQDKVIRDKITRIAAAFESNALNKYIYNVSEKSLVDFNDLAKTYSTDLILFDVNGVPLVTTQPKIYEDGLIAKKMNSRAFIYLSKLQKTEFVNDERIGELSYKAAYAPIVVNSNKIIAYIQLPYFSNEVDYKERINSLLNIMINVYALVFIAIGLLAIIIARQITAPLSFIQESLSKTIYGKKNEPIKWSRNDEIGALVKEYNKMISALENSAHRLAQSERESAWREMAKQVAHEIKNPLTPLKLGLQLLDKSWKDKDPKFDQKFERFSKSFVEQIESLSSIASEFSAFAKMPDTRIEQINLFEMLGQAVTIFRQMDNIQIIYLSPEKPFMVNADRDQLLRCFNNLLKNAIEATQPGKQGIIDINYLITSKNILLTIKDNGNGIPENMREKIFEPNFTTKSSGTGLGLAFVKNSIENANGKIWFETTTAVGTIFYLSFPSA